MFTCSCGAMLSTPRLARGWHALPSGQAVCPKCWDKQYALRAIILPVAAPVNGTWDELRKSLHLSWEKATRLAQLGVQQLLKRDVVRTPDMEKLPPMPPGNLYAECKDLVGGYEGWSQSAAAILRAVELKYRKMRYKRVWLGQASAPEYKYPQPYPIHNQAWKAYRGEGGELLVDLRLPDKRWTLRLRSGRHGRHRNSIAKQFDQIVSGEAIQGEAAIYRRRAHGTHRNGDTDRDSGGQKVPYEVVVKLVAWFPKRAEQKREGTLFVRTDSDCLLIVLDVKGERLWVENRDDLRRRVAEHYRRLQRLAADQKAETRPHPALASRRQASAEKFRRYLDSLCHEVSAHLVGFADRRRFAKIEYDDTDKRYCARFPWHKLKQMIKYKCEARGIEFAERANSPENAEAAQNDVSPDDI